MDFDSLLRIVLIVVGIGSIIFVHEMGHFLVAKLARVRVEGFSLGFPPTGVGFRRTPEGLRMTVLPNFLAYTPLEVGGLVKGSPADEAGLTLGDRILAVNDLPADRLGFRGFEQLMRDQWCCGRSVSLLVERDGERLTVEGLEQPPTADLRGLGLHPHLADQKKDVIHGEAWAWGLDPDERVEAVGNRPMAGREDFQKFASDAIARGTGVVRLHVARSAPGAEPDEAGRRQVVLLIQKPARLPSRVHTLPFLGGREGETEYRLSLIPIGGYVKMAGDAPGEGQGAPDEFLQKPVGARAAIIAAGAGMNILFALVVFVLAFQVGVRFHAPVVGGVQPGSPAEKAGLQRGDRILSINGTVVTGFLDIPSEVAFSDPDEGSAFEIDRQTPEGTQRMTVRVFPRQDSEAGRLEVGIIPPYSNVVDALKKDSPFERAGLRPKDRIVSFGGRPVTDRLSLLRAFHDAASARRRTIPFEVERDGLPLPPLALAIPEEAHSRWRVGIAPRMVFAVTSAGPDAAPLEEGDRIVAVNDDPVAPGGVADAVQRALDDEAEGDIAFRVRRDGETLVRRRAFHGPADLRRFRAGLATSCSAEVQSVADTSDYRRIGGKAGDVILSVAGRSFSSLEEMQKLIQDSGGETLALRWRDAGGEVRTGRLEPLSEWSSSLDALGIAKLGLAKEDVQLSFVDSLVVGVKKSVKFAGDVFKMLRGIFTQRLSPKNLGGPVLIVKASYHFAEDGLGKLLFFLGILGINLGIINLFPIPILDGGHLVFLGIEKLKGSPVSEPVQIVAQYAGLLILVLLMIYVTTQDLLKLAQ